MMGYGPTCFIEVKRSGWCCRASTKDHLDPHYPTSLEVTRIARDAAAVRCLVRLDLDPGIERPGESPILFYLCQLP